MGGGASHGCSKLGASVNGGVQICAMFPVFIEGGSENQFTFREPHSIGYIAKLRRIYICKLGITFTSILALMLKLVFKH